MSVEVTEKGTKIYRNESGQYHRTDGPAIEYPSGFGIYYLNGKKVTKEETESKKSSLRFSFQDDDQFNIGDTVEYIGDRVDLMYVLATVIPNYAWAREYAKRMMKAGVRGIITGILHESDDAFRYCHVEFSDPETYRIQQEIENEYNEKILFLKYHLRHV